MQFHLLILKISDKYFLYLDNHGFIDFDENLNRDRLEVDLQALFDFQVEDDEY